MNQTFIFRRSKQNTEDSEQDILHWPDPVYSPYEAMVHEVEDTIQRMGMGYELRPNRYRGFKGGCDTALCGLNCNGLCGFPAKIFYQIISTTSILPSADGRISIPNSFDEEATEYAMLTEGRRVVDFESVRKEILETILTHGYIQGLSILNSHCHHQHKIDTIVSASDRQAFDMMVDEILDLNGVSIQPYKQFHVSDEFDKHSLYRACSKLQRHERNINPDSGQPVLHICEVAAIFCYCKWSDLASAIRAVHYELVDNCRLKVFQHILRCAVVKLSHLDARNGRRKGCVYHGLCVSDLGMALEDLKNSNMYGTFVSTSSLEYTARVFADRHGVVLRINLETNKDLPAASVDWISPHLENEVLLPPLDEFLVHDGNSFRLDRGCVMMDVSATSYAARFVVDKFPCSRGPRIAVDEVEFIEGNAEFSAATSEQLVTPRQSTSNQESFLTYSPSAASTTSSTGKRHSIGLSITTISESEQSHFSFDKVSSSMPRVQSAPHLAGKFGIGKFVPRSRVFENNRLAAHRSSISSRSSASMERTVDTSLMRQEMSFGYEFAEEYHLRWPDWSVGECCKFVKSFGSAYGYVADAFEASGIDGEQLLQLTRMDLRELAVQRLHSKKVLDMRNRINNWALRIKGVHLLA